MLHDRRTPELKGFLDVYFRHCIVLALSNTAHNSLTTAECAKANLSSSLDEFH